MHLNICQPQTGKTYDMEMPNRHVHPGHKPCWYTRGIVINWYSRNYPSYTAYTLPRSYIDWDASKFNLSNVHFGEKSLEKNTASCIENRTRPAIQHRMLSKANIRVATPSPQLSSSDPTGQVASTQSRPTQTIKINIRQRQKGFQHQAVLGGQNKYQSKVRKKNELHSFHRTK